MRKAFGTIITLDYLHYALSLNRSLLDYDPSVKFKVLISDVNVDLSVISRKFDNIEFFFVDQLCQSGIGRLIYEKYACTNMDCFRWSMKPIFINYLLDQNYDQVFLLDSDLHFFSPYEFLSDDLKDSAVLLTPHWRSSNPFRDEINFSILQTSGLFNAGFIGATSDGRAAMEWWAGVCAYKCEKRPDKGLFNDQAYLNFFPVYFDKIKILRHRGCNVANWNQVECERTLSNQTNVKINHEFEIVFIHFTKSTISGIASGKDLMLKPYLDEYTQSLNFFKAWVEKFKTTQIAISKNSRSQIVHDEESVQIELNRNELFLNPRFTVGHLDRYAVRHAILSSIKRHLYDFQGVLLDVGCGQMPYRPLLTAPHTRITKYIGLDLENNPIHQNHPDITWQKEKIPLTDSSVDCAIATEVLEHCPDPEKVMREIWRVLKQDGLFFFTVPFIWPLHEVPYDYYRFTPFAIHRHLSNSGFNRIKLNALGGWDASLGQMIGLWVRRRPMRKIIRKICSPLMMPIVYLLIRSDGSVKSHFRESTMITGLLGIARKPKANNR